MLQVSHYDVEEHPAEGAVIYLHGNSGCRADFRHHVREVVDNCLALLTFDFSGSGLSQGEFVTLGLNESADLADVLLWARRTLPYKRYFLWGRSMGAVTALRYAASAPRDVAAVIADSPFISFRELLTDFGRSKTILPKMLCYPVAEVLAMLIRNRHGFDLREINLEHQVPLVDCPVIFVHSIED